MRAAFEPVRSYYAATARAAPDRPPLEGRIAVDLCIVGGGATGVSAALHAAERGLSVVLVEAVRVGFGASGRSGGQIIPGYRVGAAKLVRRFGDTGTRRLLDLADEGLDLIATRVARHAIACDLTLAGHLLVAVKPQDLAWMREEAALLTERFGRRGLSLLDAAETGRAVASTRYHGALLDARGGHLHPLNYVIGLAAAAEAAGARFFEATPALRIGQGPDGVVVTTPAGEVRAQTALVACDALLGRLVPEIAGHFMPIQSYQVATEPLDADLAAGLIAGDRAVADTKFVVDYYRLTRDRRLLFGGGERYSDRPPADPAAFVRRYLLRAFPQLARIGIDYAWGGRVSVTRNRLPHVGRIGDILFAHGWSGQGVVLTTLAGAAVADLLAGDTERFDLLTSLAPRRFPGGTALRRPLHTGGMLWYALRDRL